MNEHIIVLFQVSLLFILLFGAGELLYHFLKISAEHTRKFVHVGTGLLTLLFPAYFQHLWQVVVICLSFFLLLTISLRFNFLKSINAVSRRSAGSLLYPVIVVVVFAFYLYMKGQETAFGQRIYFVLPVLVMAICDPLAALGGNWYKKRKNISAGKTMVGSFVFLLSATILSFALLSYSAVSYVNNVTLLLHALVIALGGTVAEYISGRGWDNFTIPIAVMALLYCSNNLVL